MKIFPRPSLHVGAVLFLAVTLGGCASTESTSPAPTARVAAGPTAKPTRKPTPAPTPTRAQKRRAARKRARAERLARREKERREARARAAMAFDVPAMLGKSIEEVHARLGHVEDEGPEDDDGQMSWTKGKAGLLVEYDVSTRQTSEFFVNGIYGEPVSDRNQFLLMGNLREDDPRYRLEFVPLGRSTTQWMGVKILPNGG